MSAKAPYHHGNLRAAMIEAAVEIVSEAGAERLSVREAARRAGVSSGAPFRHFADRSALMLAVAEDGMTKLRKAIEARLAARSGTHPLAMLMAIGDAYLAWAVGHPTHYRVLGDRTQIDFAGSPLLVADNLWIRTRMEALFVEAQSSGLLRPCDLALVHLQSRALAYGLARMHVDGHLPEFGIAKSRARPAMHEALAQFLIALAADPTAARRALDAS